MRERIRFNIQIDFVIGLQLGEENIAITKPHDTHRGIARWVTNSVITRPVLGFEYMDDNVKKMFRIQEAAKYSNDTLTRIVDTINVLKRSEFS